MKIVKKKFNQKTQNEFSALLKINHENILRYFEHFECVYDEIDSTFIITEYCEVRKIIFHILHRKPILIII